jgi:2-oxoacid:acceptor oxidoreductase delta subunit (pyruvate/2-ketoisovalerate family)
LDLIRQRKYREAWELLVRENPFPGVCGRVCPHPCESECNRIELGGAIAIHVQERFLADIAMEEDWPLPTASETRKGRIAIVGAGPAGLACAYQLVLRGYRPVVFEAGDAPGGMMRLIPDYRLPARVLNHEIDALVEMGVEVQTSTRLGQDLSYSDVKDYNAVLIAVGQSASRNLGVRGEEATGVLHGIQFLQQLRLGKRVKLGPRVAVIGGGNTAIDAARSARRLGSDVVIVYRRGRQEMPAIDEEIEEAIEEGVDVRYLTAPVEILTSKGRVKGLHCVKTALGDPDGTGRRRPLPVAGSEHDIEVETIILALGQMADLEFMTGELELERGRISCDRATRTVLQGVFAGGDVATGAGSVAAAVGSGKRAALAIDRYLQGEAVDSLMLVTEAVHAVQRDHDGMVVTLSDLNLDYFEAERRTEERRLAPALRVGSFRETNLGYGEESALREAERCMSCGTCNHCDTCLILCPDVSIRRSPEGDCYEVDYDYCKGCGICAEECPRSAISIQEEAQWKK